MFERAPFCRWCVPALIVLLGVGAAGQWSATRLDGPAAAAQARDVGPAGAGAWVGFRSVAASVLWLRAYVAWERSEPEATTRWIRAACVADPRVVGFWLNGARMLAYDVPEWRLAHAGGRGRVPRAVEERIREEQVQRALRHLHQARVAHPRSAALWIEEGNLHLHRRGDVAAAAEAYRQAAEQPRAPYYALRIHAELLIRAGRPAEAHAWLTRWYPRLAALEDPLERDRAMPELVLARLRELEAALPRPPPAEVAPGPSV